MIANAPMNKLGIQRRMVELGRIRLGDKGSKGQPQKLSKFRLTSASRPLLEAAARMYGGTVRAWQGAPDDGFWELYTETDALDIMVPPVINAYSQLYEIWDAGGCTLRCDGSWESIAGEACGHGEHEGMQVTTRVSVILPKLPGLGTWRLETKGWNAAATLPAALDLLISAGRTGWLPAILRLEQQSSKKKVPGANGQLRSQTLRYTVPVVDIIGFTFAELFAAGADPELGDVQRPALGSGVVVDQHALVGPSRPPRGTKVERPPLGPAPGLPATSDFREPEQPAIAAAPPANGHATPEVVSGWIVAADEAPAPIGPPDVTSDEPVWMGGPPTEAAPIEPDVAELLRDNATASGMKGAMTEPQRTRLVELLGSLNGTGIVPRALTVLWGAEAAQTLTAAQCQALINQADSQGAEAFIEQLRAIAERQAAAA